MLNGEISGNEPPYLQRLTRYHWAAILAVCLWIFFAEKAPSFQQCQDGIEAHANSGEHPSYSTNVFDWIDNRLECHGHVVAENDTLLVALFTIVLAISTIGLWHQTRNLAKGAEIQSKDMRDSIAESSKAAKAMERLANNAAESTALGKERSAQQMRAYLSVNAGGAYFQDWANGVKFGGNPELINTGNTPAYRVTYTARAGVYETPLPSDFSFDLDAPNTIHSMTLGPRQTVNFVGLASEFVPDTEVEAVMQLTGGKGLYCWGRITYDDAFDGHHTTRFCHLIRWIPPRDGDIRNGQVSVIYIDRHNDAD